MNQINQIHLVDYQLSFHLIMNQYIGENQLKMKKLKFKNINKMKDFLIIISYEIIKLNQYNLYINK